MCKKHIKPIVSLLLASLVLSGCSMPTFGMPKEFNIPSFDLPFGSKEEI